MRESDASKCGVSIADGSKERAHSGPARGWIRRIRLSSRCSPSVCLFAARLTTLTSVASSSG